MKNLLYLALMLTEVGHNDILLYYTNINLKCLELIENGCNLIWCDISKLLKTFFSVGTDTVDSISDYWWMLN